MKSIKVLNLTALKIRDTRSTEELKNDEKAFEKGKDIGIAIGLGMYVVALSAPVLIEEISLISSSSLSWQSAFASFSSSGFLTMNTLRTGLTNAGVTAAFQYVGNGFDFSAIDTYQTTVSGIFGGYGSILLQSSLRSNFNTDGTLEFTRPSLSGFVTDATLGALAKKVNGNISSVGLSSFSPSVGGFTESVIHRGVESVGEAIENEITQDEKQN